MMEPPLFSLDSRTATVSWERSRSSIRCSRLPVTLLSSCTAPMFSEERKKTTFEEGLSFPGTINLHSFLMSALFPFSDVCLNGFELFTLFNVWLGSEGYFHSRQPTRKRCTGLQNQSYLNFTHSITWAISSSAHDDRVMFVFPEMYI